MVESEVQNLDLEYHIGNSAKIRYAVVTCYSSILMLNTVYYTYLLLNYTAVLRVLFI